jgi:hypothetical protein
MSVTLNRKSASFVQCGKNNYLLTVVSVVATNAVEIKWRQKWDLAVFALGWSMESGGWIYVDVLA